MRLSLLTLFLVSLTAQARMGDGEIGPPPLPSLPACDMGAVNACRERETSDRDSFHARAAALEPEIAAKASLLAQAANEKAAAATLVDRLSKEEVVLQDEISFLNRGETAAAKKIIPGFASVEDLFGLTPDEKSWNEAYPSARANLLNTRLAEVRAAKPESTAALQKISSDFSSLNDQYQSLKSQREQLNTEAQVHETRSGSECQLRYCPGR